MSTVISAVISSIKSATPTIKTLRIKPEGEFRFRLVNGLTALQKLKVIEKLPGIP